MSSLPTPNYITMLEYVVGRHTFDEKVLPVGTFVRPIDPVYLPDHTKETSDYKWFDNKKEVFVYCSCGIVLLPLSLIRRVS
jgi:hypothetical protein